MRTGCLLHCGQRVPAPRPALFQPASDRLCRFLRRKRKRMSPALRQIAKAALRPDSFRRPLRAGTRRPRAFLKKTIGALGTDPSPHGLSPHTGAGTCCMERETQKPLFSIFGKTANFFFHKTCFYLFLHMVSDNLALPLFPILDKSPFSLTERDARPFFVQPFPPSFFRGST